MRLSLAAPDLRGTLASDLRAIARIHTDAMADVVAGAKGELRDQVEAAGLGTRLANTWRGKAFPGSGASLEPGGFVWSKAAKIVGAFTDGASIFPTGGRRYLAIPTDNVPRKGRGQPMTPLDVEVAFNQDLIVRPGKNGRKLAFVNVIAGRNGRGLRRPTKGRLAQGRQVKLVLMFILDPGPLRLAKRLDPDAVIGRWTDRYDGLVQARFDRAFQ